MKDTAILAVLAVLYVIKGFLLLLLLADLILYWQRWRTTQLLHHAPPQSGKKFTITPNPTGNVAPSISMLSAAALDGTPSTGSFNCCSYEDLMKTSLILIQRILPPLKMKIYIRARLMERWSTRNSASTSLWATASSSTVYLTASWWGGCFHTNPTRMGGFQSRYCFMTLSSTSWISASIWVRELPWFQYLPIIVKVSHI